MVVLAVGNMTISAAHATDTGTVQSPVDVRLPMDTTSDYCLGRITWDQHSEYHVDLLRLTLRLGPTDIAITPVCVEYPTEERRISMLQTGDQINTVFFGTTQDREDKLLAAYVPIYLGTTGLRLFMARPETRTELAHIQTLDELRKFSMGQGLGWPDGQILIDSGFNVIPGRYKTLHRMLEFRRFDLYPRAYWQIIGEWNWMKQEAPNIVVSPDIALYYPQPIYFFVSPKTPQLRDVIQTGLERAYSNGMLLNLLKNHRETTASFKEVNLRRIHLLRIENRSLPEKSRQTMKKFGLFD